MKQRGPAGPGPEPAKATSRSRPRRGGRAGSGLVSGLILLLAVGGAAYGAWRGGLFERAPARAADLLTYRVVPIELVVTAVETGTLVSASSVQVFSEVEERVSIVSLVPDGTRVEAGDVVVELESALLKQRRTEQQIALEKARAALSQAQQSNIVAKSQSESDVQAAELAVEFARLDVQKYLEGDFRLDERTLATETKLAEEELQRANAPLPVLEELHRDKYLNDSELEAERFRVVRAQYKVEMAKERERLLREFTYPRQKRLLESKVIEAERALERTKRLAEAAVDQAAKKLAAEESSLRLEEAKLARFEDQITKCTLRAPQAGVVVYPVPDDDDMTEAFIREGNEIRRRQHVFSIPDTDVLEVSTAFNEAVVDQIRPGMPARVRIDVGGIELAGRVEQVAALANSEDWRRSTVKFYQARVALLEGAEGLRPSLSARVEVLIARQADVLAVPVQAVVQRGSQGVCYVLENGVPVLRRLELGRASVEHVAVLSGLAAGELVVLSPDPLGIPADAFAAEVAPAFPDATGAAAAASDPAAEPAAAPAESPIDETEFKAVLLGEGGSVAEAEYEIQRRDGVELKREFDVEVRGGEPGATWDVVVAGIPIGTVTLDAAGNGLGEWSTKKGTMPAEFPQDAGVGTEVTIGPALTGAMAR